MGSALPPCPTRPDELGAAKIVCQIKVSPSPEICGEKTPRVPLALLETNASHEAPGGTKNVYQRRPGDERQKQQRRRTKLLAFELSGKQSSSRPTRWWQWRPRVILPTERWYMYFWYFTMAFALANAILDPYDLAFGTVRGWSSDVDFWSMVEFLGTMVFFIDILLKFFLAYEDEEAKEMVTDVRSIGVHYMSLMFWLDVLFWFPFVPVILTARPDLAVGPDCSNVDIPDCSVGVGYYVGLLGFLKLGRLYRIFHLFDHLDHTMVISQMSLMLWRNFLYIILTCHWFACIFYFIARAEQFGAENSWIGRSISRFSGQSPATIYIYSFYLSVTAFAGLGDGDLYSNSPAESMAMSVYLLFNVVLGAYILGTVTMLMVKNDERSKTYRDRISNLKEYSNINDLPPDLHENMRAHLELHFQSETCSDEHVLALYPSAIRRRVLRHLYLGPLQQCYLFKNSKKKFLDAVLAVCRTDFFMPNMHLISEGDIVSDLYIMVEGEVEVMSGSFLQASDQDRNVNGSQILSPGKLGIWSTMPSARRSQSEYGSALDMDQELEQPDSAMSVTSRRGVLPGAVSERRSTSECFGEVSFFTESPSTEAVWTVSVARVLVVPRAAYNHLVVMYPRQVRSLLEDLKTRTEDSVEAMLNHVLDMLPASDTTLHTRLEQAGCMAAGMLTTTNIPVPLMRELKDSLDSEQRLRLDQLELVKDTVMNFCLKQDRQRVYEMLDAASKGEDDRVRALLGQGISPSCADCDRRTPLIVASQEGRDLTVKLLLEAGADLNAHDAFGNTALIAAIRNSHDQVADLLVEAGATLAQNTKLIMSDIMDCLVEGDLAQLASYLRGGADPCMRNQDQRSLLHVAASQGSLPAVKMLVDAGADVDAVDRWGNTPLHDAVHAQAMPVVHYLEGFVSDEVIVPLTGQGPSRPSSAHSACIAPILSQGVSALLTRGNRRRKISHILLNEADIAEEKHKAEVEQEAPRGLLRMASSRRSRAASTADSFVRRTHSSDKTLFGPRPDIASLPVSSPSVPTSPGSQPPITSQPPTLDTTHQPFEGEHPAHEELALEALSAAVAAAAMSPTSSGAVNRFQSASLLKSRSCVLGDVPEDLDPEPLECSPSRHPSNTRGVLSSKPEPARSLPLPDPRSVPVDMVGSPQRPNSRQASIPTLGTRTIHTAPGPSRVFIRPSSPGLLRPPPDSTNSSRSASPLSFHLAKLASSSPGCRQVSPSATAAAAAPVGDRVGDAVVGGADPGPGNATHQAWSSVPTNGSPRPHGQGPGSGTQRTHWRRSPLFVASPEPAGASEELGDRKSP